MLLMLKLVVKRFRAYGIKSLQVLNFSELRAYNFLHNETLCSKYLSKIQTQHIFDGACVYTIQVFSSKHILRLIKHN